MTEHPAGHPDGIQYELPLTLTQDRPGRSSGPCCSPARGRPAPMRGPPRWTRFSHNQLASPARVRILWGGGALRPRELPRPSLLSLVVFQLSWAIDCLASSRPATSSINPQHGQVHAKGARLFLRNSARRRVGGAWVGDFGGPAGGTKSRTTFLLGLIAWCRRITGYLGSFNCYLRGWLLDHGCERWRNAGDIVLISWYEQALVCARIDLQQSPCAPVRVRLMLLLLQHEFLFQVQFGHHTICSRLMRLVDLCGKRNPLDSTAR